MQTRKCSPGKQSDHFDHNESDNPPTGGFRSTNLGLRNAVRSTYNLAASNYRLDTHLGISPPSHWPLFGVRPCLPAHNHIMRSSKSWSGPTSCTLNRGQPESGDRDRHILLLDARQRIVLPRLECELYLHTEPVVVFCHE